jgi:hypothetical protein
MQSKEETIVKIAALNDKQQEEAKKYVDEGCCGLAYLAKWSVLEFALKELDMLRTQHEQRIILHNLLLYLDEGGANPAQRRVEIPVQHKFSLPPIIRIPTLLGNCPELSEIFDTKQKFRQKRNNIAHKAEHLSPKVCAEYLKKLDSGIEELFRALTAISWLQ